MTLSTQPPIALMTSILISWVFSAIAPFTFIVPNFIRSIAALFVVLGVILITLAVSELQKNKTTLLPEGAPTALVKQGPYRLTRNPIYVGYLLCAMAAAWYFGSLTGCVGPLYFFWIMNSSVIPMEERKLREKFGYAYGEYLLNTKRWL